MNKLKALALSLIVALTILLTPTHASATSWAGEKYLKIVYYCGTTVGTGNHSGLNPSNCAPIVDGTVFTAEAKTSIERAYVVITTAITGTTDLDVGVSGTSNGFIDGSLSLTLGTAGLYGWDAKNAGSFLRIQTAGATDAGDIYVVPTAKYFTAATAILLDVTTTNTAGAFQLVFEGTKFK